MPANPANGRPGPGATLYHAEKVADWLEEHAPRAPGEKNPSASRDVFWRAQEESNP
ncbi:MAG: hypothetical protein LBN96_01210 [Desulfovibrio sp.]|nr:hypothetical protein [Desulfovibrio sp.]